jgi:hypothetical protein
MFIKTNSDLNGTHRIGTLAISPKDLLSKIGLPIFSNNDDCSDGKVSGEYIFKEVETNKIVTLYDYKATNFYDNDLPSPEEFWKSDETFFFSIGGHNNDSELVDSFISWIKGK